MLGICVNDLLQFPDPPRRPTARRNRERRASAPEPEIDRTIGGMALAMKEGER
jgi:hypothetical protein